MRWERCARSAGGFGTAARLTLAFACTLAACRGDAPASSDDAAIADAATVDAASDAAVDADAGDPVDASDAETTDGGPVDAGLVDTTAAWVLSYFGPGQTLDDDSLHLAFSTDGLHWTQLGSGPAFRLSGIGTNHIRDPFLFRKQDGTFVYLATDWTLAENDANYWNRPSSQIVVADSNDLITFTAPRRLDLNDLTGPGGSEMHAWAPEAYYDATRDAYGIVWSGNDTTNYNRLYVSHTRDFATVLDITPTLFFDPGYRVIDGTLVPWRGRNYLVFKYADPVEDIQIARSNASGVVPGTFQVWDSSFLGTSATTGRVLEGPFVVRIPGEDRFYVFADLYNAGGVFRGFTSTNLDADPASWTPLVEGSFRFPPGVRHANTVRVTQAELDAMIAHYGVEPPITRIRTNFLDGSEPAYVAHSWFHAVITRLADGAQLADDFRWRIVPGLADPEDPTLFSIESVGFPGRYLRIDGANPARYPACGEGSNRNFEACNYVPLADRHHLAWLDAFVDTATFRGDATFRRVAARNGDPAGVSVQWYGDPTLHLRHLGYQLFAHDLSGGVPDADATFLLESE